MTATVVAQTLWEEQLPLAFLDGVTPLGRDLQGLAAALGRAVPISHLAALHPQRPFLQRSVAVRSGDLVVSAVAHSGIYGENLVQEKAVFSMPFFGEKRFRVGGQTFLTRAGQDSIFLPVEPFSVETTAFSGVAFCVNPWRLARVADTMAGPEREPVALVRQPLLFSDADPVQGHLLGVLRKTLALIDLVTLDDGVVPAMVRLDDLILRLLALLVYPKLLAGSTAVEHPATGPQAEAALEALIDTMRVDLAHPWGLTDLERASGLSRPQLDQAFRARFSCSPLQWLRRQRLCWARQVLERPGNRLGLWDLAQLCGYRSQEEFRREFQGSFLLTPDRLLELAQRRDAEK
jgi:AraC-like DNA-binding protein